MMKKFFVILSVAGLLLSTASCNKLPGGDADLGPGTLRVDWGEQETKGNTSTLAGESAINSLVIYVFDHNGRLDIAHNCTSAEISGKSASITVKSGTKTVFALANLTGTSLTNANAAKTLAELKAVSFTLGANTTSGLVMWAEKANVTISGGGNAPCALSMARYVSKIALKSVTNSLPGPYGAVKLKQAFLCNVTSNALVQGTPSDLGWVNQQATSDHAAANHVIGTGSYKASFEALTFKDLGNANLAAGGTVNYSTSDANGRYFYAFPNSVTTLPGGYTSTFTPTCTVLMLVVTISSVDYYYPIPLSSKLYANTDNTVAVTLTALGNTLADDPFKKIEKGTLNATITVSDWANGSTYVESI